MAGALLVGPCQYKGPDGRQVAGGGGRGRQYWRVPSGGCIRSARLSRCQMRQRSVVARWSRAIDKFMELLKYTQHCRTASPYSPFHQTGPSSQELGVRCLLRTCRVGSCSRPLASRRRGWHMRPPRCTVAATGRVGDGTPASSSPPPPLRPQPSPSSSQPHAPSPNNW